MKMAYEKPVVETFDFKSQEQIANNTGIDPSLNGGYEPAPVDEDEN